MVQTDGHKWTDGRTAGQWTDQIFLVQNIAQCMLVLLLLLFLILFSFSLDEADDVNVYVDVLSYV